MFLFEWVATDIFRLFDNLAIQYYIKDTTRLEFCEWPRIKLQVSSKRITSVFNTLFNSLFVSCVWLSHGQVAQRFQRMRNNVQVFLTVSSMFRAASDGLRPLIALLAIPWRYLAPIDQRYPDGNVFLARHARPRLYYLRPETNSVFSSTLPDELTHPARFTSNLPHLRVPLHKSA